MTENIGETITRKFIDHDENLQPRYSITREPGRIRRDLPGFLASMAARLGLARTHGAGKLLSTWADAVLGEDAKADDKAVKMGADLDAWQRHTVIRLLRQWQADADVFCPDARPLLDGLYQRWAGRWGDQHPEPNGFQVGGSRREIAEQEAAYASLPPRKNHVRPTPARGDGHRYIAGKVA